jgi:hypothetical protein
MCGRATFTMDESSTIMSWAVAMTARARPSRRGGCRVVAAVAADLAATAIPGVVPVSGEVADKIIPFVCEFRAQSSSAVTTLARRAGKAV